jgi:hypothetical protein
VEFFQITLWSSTGLLIERPDQSQFYLRAYDMDAEDFMERVLWVYLGLVIRKGDDVNAKIKAREAEFKECWKKRWPYYRRKYHPDWNEFYTKEQQDKIYKDWWDAPVGESNEYDKDPGRYYAAVSAVSPDLKYCYIYEWDETAEGPIAYYGHEFGARTGRYLLWNLETGERTPVPAWADGKVTDPKDLSRDQRFILTYGKAGPLVAWRENWETYRRFTFVEAPQRYFFSPDSRMVAVYSVGHVSVFDIEQDRRIVRIEEGDLWKTWMHSKSYVPYIEHVEFSPDSRYLWVYRGRPGFPGAKPGQRTNLVWDIRKNRRVKGITDEQMERTEGFGPVPGTVVLGASDRLQVVHIGTGTVIAELLLPSWSTPRRYLATFPPDRNHRETRNLEWKFRVIPREDGLVIGGMEKRYTVTVEEELVYPPHKGNAHWEKVDPPQVREQLGKYYLIWTLAPHMDAFKARVAALDAQGK